LSLPLKIRQGKSSLEPPRSLSRANQDCATVCEECAEVPIVGNSHPFSLKVCIRIDTSSRVAVVRCYTISTKEVLALCAGEETYAALQNVLEEMETGSLRAHVDVPICAGSEETERILGRLGVQGGPPACFLELAMPARVA
jgi:molybdopterin-binding protein